MDTELLQKVNNANKDLSYKDAIEIIEYDFKKLASIENKSFKRKNYEYGKNVILNWFEWQKINIELEDNDKQNGWKEGYAPDNCWSSETLYRIYKKLDWCECKIYSDAINSFFTTYTFAIHTFEDELTALNDNSVVFGQSGKDYISLRKLLKDDKFHNYTTINTFECLQTLAKLTHTIGNFTPCFDGEFNSTKGVLPDVKDYLPLMVDKIEKCLEENIGILDKTSNKNISVRTLLEWKKFLINNREKFFLEDYYYVQKQNENEKIIGIPLFKTQSIKHPIPNKEELEECIKEINKRIYNRGLKIVCKIISKN